MRERLVATTVGISVLFLVVFAIARAYALTTLVRDQEAQKVEQFAHLSAVAIEERLAGGRPVDEDFLATLAEEVQDLEYVAPDGERVQVSDGSPLAAGEPFVEATSPVRAGGEVTVGRSTEYVDQLVADAVLRIVLLGLFLVALAGVVGFLAAQRLAAPFRHLAGIAGEFGRGRFDVEVPHYSVPEAEVVADAMREAQTEVTELVRRERDFAVSASHQLRTPITALRLELEDVTLWPETDPKVAAHLQGVIGEVDRLSSSLGDLLDVARGRRLTTTRPVNLSAIVEDSVERWRPAARERGRDVVFQDRVPVPARVRPSAVHQILDALIASGIEFGQGRLTVTVEELDTHLRIQICDEGSVPQPRADDFFWRKVGCDDPGDGPSLQRAKHLADALGGRLSLRGQPQTALVLQLPKLGSDADSAPVAPIG